MAHISIRQSIKWSNSEASESTDTLVLTSPEQRFVDLRILKDEDVTAVDPETTLPLSKLDWAFAGTSLSSILPAAAAAIRAAASDESEPLITHSKWMHWIDSKTRTPEDVVDEGDMRAIAEDLTLETGRMLNPSSGQVEDYEEVWKEVLPLATTNKRTPKELGGECYRQCVVLMLDDDEHEARGLVVRVGHCCQGFLRAKEELALERWMWSEEGGWAREVRMGSLFVPCGVTFESSFLSLGASAEYGEFVWQVIERSEF